MLNLLEYCARQSFRRPEYVSDAFKASELAKIRSYTPVTGRLGRHLIFWMTARDFVHYSDGATINFSTAPYQERTKNFTLNSGTLIYYATGLNGRPVLYVNPTITIEFTPYLSFSTSQSWSVVFVVGTTLSNTTFSFRLLSSKSPLPTVYISPALSTDNSVPRRGRFGSAIMKGSGVEFTINPDVVGMATVAHTGTVTPVIGMVSFDASTGRVYIVQGTGTWVPYTWSTSVQSYTFNTIGSANNSVGWYLYELLVYNGCCLTCSDRTSEFARLLDTYFRVVMLIRPVIWTWVNFNWFKPRRSFGRLLGAGRSMVAGTCRFVSPELIEIPQSYQGTYMDDFSEYELDSELNGQFRGFRWPGSWTARTA